jgi:hypothetical protein
MRRGLLIAALAVALIAELVIAVVILPRLRHDAVAVPQRVLIGFALDRMPVPGWRVTGSDLGLPADVPLGQAISAVGDRAYFVTGCDDDCIRKRCNFTCDDSRGWLYGLDLRTGARLFKPVLLNGFRYHQWFHDCRQNGPSVAVCLNNEVPRQGQSGRVWIVDLERGKLTYSGKTDLWQDNVPGPGPYLQAVGNPRGQTRLVAGVAGKGIYGVGPRAELTWFVPGSGHLVAPVFSVDDGSPPILATQLPTADDPRYRVFSVIDGTERTPTAPPGSTLKRAIVYTGGFAYQYEATGTVGVLFYDSAGRQVARRELKGYNLMEATPVPIVLDQPVFRVYAPDGREVATLPGAFAYHQAPMFWAMGDDLYLRSEENLTMYQTWQRWNLGTGRPGTTCHRQAPLTFYVGSDGRIVLLKDEENGVAVVAVDLATCRALWRMPQPGLHSIEQLGSALVDRAPGELRSLRAP